MSEMTTVGDLLDRLILSDPDRKWVVLSFQPELDKPEVVGPFSSEKDAQLWSESNFNAKVEIRHQVQYMVNP